MSPKLQHGPNGVSDGLCSACYLRDHASSPAPPARLSLGEQIASVALAYARWFAAGRPRPTPEQLKERQDLCSFCPEKVEVSGESRCGKCGCPLNKVVHLFGTVERPGKLEMSTEECPIGKWKSLI